MIYRDTHINLFLITCTVIIIIIIILQLLI